MDRENVAGMLEAASDAVVQVAVTLVVAIVLLTLWRL